MHNLNLSHKRMYDRYEPETDSIQATISFKGVIVPCSINDISLGGIGATIENMNFPIPEDEIIKIELETEDLRTFQVFARIVYSHRVYLSKNPFASRYGLEFLTPENKGIELLIDNCC